VLSDRKSFAQFSSFATQKAAILKTATVRNLGSMALRKLSDSDKRDIIELYKQPNQTTSTLAEQYGVSNSTVSRILKTTLAPEEYSELIAQKRMTSTDKAEPDIAESASSPAQDGPESSRPTVQPPKLKTALKSSDAVASDAVASDALDSDDRGSDKGNTRRRNRRKRADDDEQLPLLVGADSPASEISPPKPAAPILAGDDDRLALDEDLDEELDAALDDDFDDDLDEEDLDDEDDFDDDEDIDPLDLLKPKRRSATAMEIMPIGAAVLPKPCYLVVDMRSELITRPLSDFSDLGQVPTSQEKEKTLPVFDNHRVARRFSRNKQRVIKVPDGDLIARTSPYLQAKGITRLIIDGQVFELDDSD
jgi:transposase-like protein